MSIKYDGKIGKLFQTNIATAALEKDKIEFSQLREKLGGTEIKLNSATPCSINVLYSIEQSIIVNRVN